MADLRQMLPNATVDNVADGRLTDPESSSQRTPCLTLTRQCANITNVILAQSQNRVMLTTLLDLIGNVHFGGAEEEVIGATARGRIAAMAHHHAFGNWSVGQLIGKTMGANNLAINADLPIPLRRQVPTKEPTFSALVYPRPESHCGRLAVLLTFAARKLIPAPLLLLVDAVIECSHRQYAMTLAAFARGAFFPQRYLAGAAAPLQAHLTPALVKAMIKGIARQYAMTFLALLGRLRVHLLNLHYRFGGATPQGVSAPLRLRCVNYTTEGA